MPLSNNNNEDCKEILEAGTCRIGFLHWQPRIQSHKCVVGNFNNYADKEFEKRGLQLLTFSAQLEFSRAVRDKIDSRNEVNTNISVLDQKIEEQKKQNELEQLKTEQALIASRGLTREILYKQFIDKWDGKTPLYGIAPEFLKMTK